MKAKPVIPAALAVAALSLTACTATSNLGIPQSQNPGPGYTQTPNGTTPAPGLSSPSQDTAPAYVVSCKMIHAYSAWVPKVTVTNNGPGTLYLPDSLGGGPDNGPLAFTVEFMDASDNVVSTDTQDSMSFGPISAAIAAGQSQSFKTFSPGGTFAETPQLDQSGTDVASCTASITGGIPGQNDGF